MGGLRSEVGALVTVRLLLLSGRHGIHTEGNTTMIVSNHGRMLGTKGERRLGTRAGLKRGDRRAVRQALRNGEY
ncbi:hypothetical protein HNP02_007073 [Mycobacterium sp. AZCC_0083]|nr:hypothetical protein [Mycobacterium sp. AZCC_0083]